MRWKPNTVPAGHFNKKTELACYLAREAVLVNQVVSAGNARYSNKERLLVKRIWVVPRRELFVPDVDEGFFVLKTMDGRRRTMEVCMVNGLSVYRPILKGGTHEP
ncbi:MAG: hypothetical protein KJZ72_08115 [Anaerolineales bacterium]|nr:hypothetical protein [Anaerolineales bacterium]